MAAIEADSLTKRYGSVLAVSDLDIHVERGEIFGFLGPNGAGKSTTINMLLDFVRPSSGEATVLGFDPQTQQRDIRQRIGILPEASGYYERTTARDHVEFAARMKRVGDDPEAILDRVGIVDAADRAVGGFSTGMRQRLGLGMALVGDPELLILDEPMAGLDPMGARLLREIVREERDRGAAVFFSSHIMEQVETLCDRVGILNDGELVSVGSIEQLRSAADSPSTLVVSVDSIPEDLDLEAVDGVRGVDARNGTLQIVCADGRAKATVVSRIDAAGAAITDIDNESASLEQLFLEIAGAGTKE